MRRSPFRSLARSTRGLFAKPTSAIGASLFLLFIILALFGPWIAPYGENEQLPGQARQAPSPQHPFGTDNLGRDVYSRVVLGARDILILAGLGTLVAVLAGLAIGLISGYWGGWFDEIVMRLFDSLLSIPALLFALMLLGAVGPSSLNVLIVIIVVYTPIVARVVRSLVLSARQRGFVEASRIRGEKTSYILFKDILPVVIPALAVESALRFSYAIFLVASLGFLGAGVQPPSPDWGLMVKEARNHIYQTPWAMYFPAGAIAVLVIAVNLTADGIRRVWRTAG